MPTDGVRMFLSGLSLIMPSPMHQDIKLERALKRLLTVALDSPRFRRSASQARTCADRISSEDRLTLLSFQKDAKSPMLSRYHSRVRWERPSTFLARMKSWRKAGVHGEAKVPESRFS